MLTLRRETCSIQPVELRLTRKGIAVANEEKITTASDAHTDSNTNVSTTTNTEATSARMIDYGVGLRLSDHTLETIYAGWKYLSDGKKSLNQTLSYATSVPFFLDVELKKPNQARTPEVQLAIWQAALFKKRQYHGWDLSMPMPGICIRDHEWSFYITFHDGEDRLVCHIWLAIYPPK